MSSSTKVTERIDHCTTAPPTAQEDSLSHAAVYVCLRGWATVANALCTAALPAVWQAVHGEGRREASPVQGLQQCAQAPCRCSCSSFSLSSTTAVPSTHRQPRSSASHSACCHRRA